MSQRDLVARLMLLGAALLLSACAGQPPLPAGQPTLALPLQLHVQQSQDQQRQDWVLVIQREEPGIRWSMMDLLGIPQARQILVNGQWQADGPECVKTPSRTLAMISEDFIAGIAHEALYPR